MSGGGEKGGPEGATLDALLRYSRVIASAARPEEVLSLLADAGVEHVGAEAAAVVAVAASGEARLAASRGLPKELAAWHADPDAVGDEIGHGLCAACNGRFARAHSLPLVSGGDLFGTLVLLLERNEPLDPDRVALAAGLADLAAIGLGRAEQFAALSRSYAELRASRELLAQTEKLRALGQMAAGVSHDLKNILNPLSLHLQFLSRIVPKDVTDAHESIQEMRQVLARGVETIERLREFSRQTPSAKVELVDLNRIVREAAKICAARLAARRAPRVTIDDRLGEPGLVAMRASEGVAAIVNLVVNAIDALAEGGTITLTSGAEDGGGWVRIADDGPGMPPEVQQRVFEPFFTTKGTEGTGLGLAMVYAFAQRHGGRVTLETAPGEGAAFTLWLPSAAPGPG